MQVFLTRREIRRRLRASLGQTTDEGLATMNRAKLDDTIDRAALYAHADMRPLRAQKEETFVVGIQQSLIDYPADAGPGSFVSAAVYDADGKLYWPLRRKRRRVDQADDQALAAGGDDLAAVTDTPRSIADDADGWLLYPTTDKAYAVRVIYNERQLFFADEDESTVDAMLILSYAAYLEKKEYDENAAKADLGDYAQRKALLKGFEQTGAAISYDREADFDDICPGDEPPRWDTRPARQG